MTSCTPGRCYSPVHTVMIPQTLLRSAEPRFIRKTRCGCLNKKFAIRMSHPLSRRQPYIVFNHDSQKFDHVVGITNSDLIAWMRFAETDLPAVKIQAKAVRAAIWNCFEMLGNDGCGASHADLLDYRGNFSPQFYPMRYAVKDPILQQQPIVYSVLMNHVATAYVRNGVSYAELSVSLKTIMSPCFQKYLAEDRVWPQLLIASYLRPYFHAKVPFTYRFLAGIPRTKAAFSKLNGWIRGARIQFEPHHCDVAFWSQRVGHCTKRTNRRCFISYFQTPSKNLSSLLQENSSHRFHQVSTGRT